MTYLTENKVEWIEDPTNQRLEINYQRSRLQEGRLANY